MKVHEFQAKEIFQRYGVPVPPGGVAGTPDEAEQVARGLGGGRVVVKAQIHAGGRGKGGGVKLADDASEARDVASQILGMTLVTKQTGPEGKKVHRVLVEAALDIQHELYLGVVLDRALRRPVIIASMAGGMEIEEVAEETPEKIARVAIDPGLGLCDFQCRQLAREMGLPKQHVRGFSKFVRALWNVYQGEDASMVEINPLVITGDGGLLALDAKLDLDDNAMYRHETNADFRDRTEEDPLEVKASEHGLNYIRLDGNVGCMVNGAGLAMATMDLIKLAGGEPANFLDVGGSASAETVGKALEIIRSDANVKAILINIFGGIVRCDRVAQGVIDGARQVGLDLPVVIRLRGTNAEEAGRMLSESGLSFTVASELGEAARKVVEAAGA